MKKRTRTVAAVELTLKREPAAGDILLTKDQVADLFRVSVVTVYNWINNGKIRKAGPGKFLLRDILDYYVRLNIVTPAVHDSKRVDKLDADIAKVKAETALREQEARMLARQELSQAAPTDKAMLALYAKLLKQFSNEAAAVLVRELVDVFRALPHCKSMRAEQVLSLAAGWAGSFIDKMAVYALSDDLYSYQKSQLWKDTGGSNVIGGPATGMPLDEPVWVPASTVGGNTNEGKWYKMILNPAFDQDNPANYELRYKFIEIDGGPPPESSILEIALRNQKPSTKGE